MQSARQFLLLFLERDRDGGVRGKAKLVSLDVSKQAAVDVMPMPLVSTLAAIRSRQPDATICEAVDGADVNAVSTDDFHSRTNL